MTFTKGSRETTGSMKWVLARPHTFEPNIRPTIPDLSSNTVFHTVTQNDPAHQWIWNINGKLSVKTSRPLLQYRLLFSYCFWSIQSSQHWEGQVHGHLINWLISGDQDQGTGASLAAKANWALIQDTMALGIDTSTSSNPSHPQEPHQASPG